MVDRVYKVSIPQLRRALEQLQRRFSELGTKVDWNGVRVRPVLKHAEALEHLLRSRRFSREFSRLSRGVELFHSDLVYLRANVQGLTRILESEGRSKGREDPRRPKTDRR